MAANLKSWFRKSIPDEQLRSYDPLAHALTIIDENHRLIHDGMFFEVQQSVVPLGIGGVIDIGLNVPADAFPHFQELEVLTDQANIAVDFLEGVTATIGAAANVRNKNRNSSRTAQTGVNVLTGVSGGLPLKNTNLPIAGQFIVFNQGLGGEWVLQPDTLYTVRFTNNSGVAANLSIGIQLYELDYPVDGTALETPFQQT